MRRRSIRRLALVALFAWPLGCGGVAKKNSYSPQATPLSEQTYSHYLRGKLALFRRNYAEAERELNKAKRVAPREAPISRALADAHYQAGHRKAAEAEILWATKTWPKNAQVWAGSGALHRSARRFAEAASDFGRAIQLGANDEATRVSYGETLALAGKTAKSMKAFKFLIAEGKEANEAHYQYARLWHQEGNATAAETHARQAAIGNPYDLRAWALLATSLREQGKTQEADDTLRRPFDRSRGDVGVGEQLFIQLLDLAEPEAAQQLVGTLDRDDLDLDTRIGMGHWLLSVGDYEGALARSRSLDTKAAPSAAILELRAQALRGLHRDGDAAIELEAIGKDDPGYPLIESLRAEIFLSQGKHEKAKATIERALGLAPDNPDLIMAQAAVAEASGQLENARTILTTALANHPMAQRPMFALAELETRHNRIAQAIATVTPLLEAQPHSFAALNYIGYSLIDNPDAQERAQDLLLRALELAPDSAFVLDSYGWFLLRAGRTVEAAPLLERAVRLTPTEPELLAHLAELRWHQGRPAQAEEILVKAQGFARTADAKRVVSRARQRLQKPPPPQGSPTTQP